MSERIKQLIYVIQYVKKNYKGVNLSQIRKDAAIQVAQKLEITYNTVADKYLR